MWMLPCARNVSGCCALCTRRVGLRPGRSSVRLELGDSLTAPGAGPAVPVIHNYGHGGSGLTLAWGCAGDAVRLAKQALGI